MHLSLFSSPNKSTSITWHTLPLLFLICIISCSSIYAGRRRPFRPSEYNLNVMTVTRSDTKPDTTACELVKKIHRRRMPDQAIIPIEGNAYRYEKGIAPLVKNAEHIYLMSRGYAKRIRITGTHKDDHFIRRGGCVIHTHDRIAQHAVPLTEKSVAVTFDYQDGHINFGQKRDIACLKFVYDAIRQTNPSAPIIIVSECLGAKTALELAVQHPLEKTTLVLESPFFQATDIFELMATNYVKWDGFASLFKWVCSAFGHYEEQSDNLYNRLHRISKDICIFSCHRNNDRLLKDSSFESAMDTLAAHLGPDNLSAYRFDDTERELHSSTFRWPGCQEAVNHFYKKHRLPYINL